MPGGLFVSKVFECMYLTPERWYRQYILGDLP